MRTVLITGGLGFIGSNLVRYWSNKYLEDRIIVCDCETYAARPKYLDDIKSKFELKRLNINDQSVMHYLFKQFKPDHVLHLAAESHVCNSINDPKKFFRTNIDGTINLLEAFRTLHGNKPDKRFLHVSTDEVFGSLGYMDPPFTEQTQIDPTSPYAASKAASDLIVNAYHWTYGLNTVITNCSNNYGPNQHFEKLIPATIKSLLTKTPVRIYQDGQQIRDWLFVMDHCEAIDVAFHKGLSGQRYVIGGTTEERNLDIIDLVHESMEEATGERIEMNRQFVDARPTDDTRYSVNWEKMEALGWYPKTELREGLMETVLWYLDTMKQELADSQVGSDGSGETAHVK